MTSINDNEFTSTQLFREMFEVYGRHFESHGTGWDSMIGTEVGLAMVKALSQCAEELFIWLDDPEGDHDEEAQARHAAWGFELLDLLQSDDRFYTLDKDSDEWDSFVELRVRTIIATYTHERVRELVYEVVGNHLANDVEAFLEEQP